MRLVPGIALLALTAAAPGPDHLEIDFQPGSAGLTRLAKVELDLAADLYKHAKPYVMFITGYADRSGDEFSNLLLSARRASAIKQGLVARGVPQGLLMLRALGSSDLLNEDDPTFSRDRRVVVTWRVSKDAP